MIQTSFFPQPEKDGEWERPFPKKRNWPKQEFHYRKKIKVRGKENQLYQCKDCHEFLPVTVYSLAAADKDGIYILARRCRPCRKKYDQLAGIVAKNAPPAPEHCACCHQIKKLEPDHVHKSTVFRGWVCRNCNTGIGKLEDTLTGVLQAAVYLENDKNKIIETLNKVFNEMFARTK